MLGKALDFYTMSHVTLITKQSLNQLSRPCLELLNFVLMSLVNNMGHVHAYFRNIEEAKICGGELCKRLSPLIRACAGRPAISNNNEEYRVFFLNVCFFSESELSSAPAAWWNKFWVVGVFVTNTNILAFCVFRNETKRNEPENATFQLLEHL